MYFIMYFLQFIDDEAMGEEEEEEEDEGKVC